MSNPSNDGAAAGSKVSGAFKEAGAASENVRNGINSFFDNTIQPSAARDAERGVTATHKVPHDPSQDHPHSGTGPAMGTGSAGLTSGGTHSSAGATGSGGISGDAKALGQGIKDSINKRM